MRFEIVRKTVASQKTVGWEKKGANSKRPTTCWQISKRAPERIAITENLESKFCYKWTFSFVFGTKVWLALWRQTILVFFSFIYYTLYCAFPCNALIYAIIPAVFCEAVILLTKITVKNNIAFIAVGAWNGSVDDEKHTSEFFKLNVFSTAIIL